MQYRNKAIMGKLYQLQIVSMNISDRKLNFNRLETFFFEQNSSHISYHLFILLLYIHYVHTTHVSGNIKITRFAYVIKSQRNEKELQHLTSNFDSSTREFSYHNVTRVPLNFAELSIDIILLVRRYIHKLYKR